MSEAVLQLVEASKSLSVEEQMELFGALWEIVDEYAVVDAFELSPEQRTELDRRWEQQIRDPESAIFWEEGKERLIALREKP